MLVYDAQDFTQAFFKVVYIQVGNIIKEFGHLAFAILDIALFILRFEQKVGEELFVFLLEFSQAQTEIFQLGRF